MKHGAARWIVTIAAALAAGAFMLYGVAGLAPFGSYHGAYGDLIVRVAVAQRHALNVATAINFDYRGFDTLIEEFILFTAVAGVTLLFREQLGPHERHGGDPDVDYELAPESDGIGWMGFAFVPLGALFAIYIAIHGHLTPGGGFQAGAIAASAYALVYFGQHYRAMKALVPHAFADALESIGGGGYGLIGVAAALVSGVFLTNVLPLGKTGDILSAGTIPAINACVFVEVTFGFVTCLELFVKQTRKTEKSE